jgi:hypothetical protein
MSDQSHHEMVLETTHPSGIEEWYCPICGRRMTIKWQPWEKIILEPGDIYVAHGGSKGIMNIGRLQINHVDEAGRQSAMQSSVEDPYLAPWVHWLEKMDWEDWDEEG